VLDSHRASCGCIAFEIPGNADIHELRIGQGQTVPVRVLIGTAGRYGQLTHHVALGFRTLETDKKFELRTAIELDIKANLRCSPPSLFLAKGKTATRGIIYSGTKIPATSLYVDESQTSFVKIVELTESEAQMALESLYPIAAVEIAFDEKRLIENTIFVEKVLIKSTNEKYELTIPVASVSQDSRKIWPTKIFVHDTFKSQFVRRSINVVCARGDSVRLANLPEGISYSLDTSRSGSQSLDFIIDSSTFFSEDRQRVTLKVSIGLESFPVDFLISE